MDVLHAENGLKRRTAVLERARKTSCTLRTARSDTKHHGQRAAAALVPHENRPMQPVYYFGGLLPEHQIHPQEAYPSEDAFML